MDCLMDPMLFRYKNTPYIFNRALPLSYDFFKTSFVPLPVKIVLILHAMVTTKSTSKRSFPCSGVIGQLRLVKQFDGKNQGLTKVPYCFSLYNPLYFWDCFKLSAFCCGFYRCVFYICFVYPCCIAFVHSLYSIYRKK